MRQSRSIAAIPSAVLVAAAALLAAPCPGAAQDVRLFAVGEGGPSFMLTESYRDRFGLGGHVTARLALGIDELAVQLGAGNWWFSNADGEMGRMYAFELGVRQRVRVAEGFWGGPFADVNAGLGVTGGLERFVFDAGVGWELDLSDWLGAGPVVRYQHVLQSNDNAVPFDARMLSVGLFATLRMPTFGGSSPAGPPEPASEPDADGDRLPDTEDRCPGEPEDVDGYRDDDGCPDADNDSDGVADTLDRCPDRPEIRNGFEDDDGCPDEPPARTSDGPAARTSDGPTARTSGERTGPAAPRPSTGGEPLAERVFFRPDRSYVSRRYRDEIESVAAKAEEQPGARLRVIGHADERDTAWHNERLSARRAGNVAMWIVQCGVDAERVEVVAYGETRPACNEDTRECRRRNRRVEFQLVE